jgi:hypothetical protein
LPLSLRPFIATLEAETTVPPQRQLGYGLNKHCGLGPDGFQLSSSKREAAQMEAKADAEDRLVDELINAPVDPTLASAIEAGQEFHASASALEVAEARYAAKERDAAFAAAEERQEETVAAYDLHGFVQPEERARPLVKEGKMLNEEESDADERPWLCNL